METYYKKNRAKLLAYAKKYREDHAEYFKDYRNKYKSEHPDKIKAYRQKRAGKQKEYYEKWYKENGRKRADNYQECIFEWGQKYPGRRKISRQLNSAITSGKIIRPSVCPKCGREARIQAHHYNYEHFMNFVFLCASCHKKEHCSTIIL